MGVITTRFTLALLVAWAATGCEAAVITPPGVPPPGTDGGPPPDLTPRECFERDVEPRLRSQCGSCHDIGGRPGVIFLEGASYYDAVRAWPNALFVPGEPDMSTLITTPADSGHSGGPWDGSGDVEAVRSWIVKEGETGDTDGGMPMCTVRQSEPMDVAPSMSIRLDSVCDFTLGLSGSRLELSTTAGAAGALSLSGITFYAGRNGLAADDATFVLVDPDTGAETPMGGTFASTVRLAAGQNELIGNFDIPAYTSGLQLAVRFASIGTNSAP